MAKRSEFPVQKSLLDANELGCEVAEQYDLPLPVGCELFAQGLNDTYILSADDDKYALRVYRSGWRTDDDVAFELELLEHLAREGANVCAPLRSRSGGLSLTLDAPEGRRQVALFEFAAGTPIAGTQWSGDDARAYGEGVALVHAGMDTFTSQHRRLNLDLDHLLAAPLSELEPRLIARTDDWSYLQQVAESLRNSILERANDLTWGICHGDFHGGNARRVKEGPYRFFDFDCGGFGWRAYDIAVFRWGVLRLPGNQSSEDLWQAFTDAYSTERYLKATDLAAVPDFVAIRQIWLMGLHAAFGKERGAAFLNDAYFDRQMKILRECVEKLD